MGRPLAEVHPNIADMSGFLWKMTLSRRMSTLLAPSLYSSPQVIGFAGMIRFEYRKIFTGCRY